MDDFEDALFTFGVSWRRRCPRDTQLKVEVLDTFKNKPPVRPCRQNDVAVLMSIVYKR